MQLKERIILLLEELGKQAFEREEVISLALLSALSGESIFLLGLPGVGKSMIARRLKLAFANSTSFEYLMSRFSTPDEIFGPVSISKLKDRDTYERTVDGYLPTADIVFLDEIWKAGPAIQNTLLTVLNERIFRNGKQDLALPIKAIIAASNELPAEGEGLEALWDRFLIRYIVQPIARDENFVSLLTKRTPYGIQELEYAFSLDELNQIKQDSMHITIPNSIIQVILDLRNTLNKTQDEFNESLNEGESDRPPYVSDRRWKKIIGILQTSALLNGRSEIDLSDCILLEHMLWDNDSQVYQVKELLTDAITNQLLDYFSLDFNGSISSHVGELYSPDKMHYILEIDNNEELLISKFDYAQLNSNITYGQITDDDRLILTPSGGPIKICLHEPGMICINSFIYPIKRKNTLPTISTNQLSEKISSNQTQRIEASKEKIANLIQNNVFIQEDKWINRISSTLTRKQKRQLKNIL